MSLDDAADARHPQPISPFARSVVCAAMMVALGLMSGCETLDARAPMPPAASAPKIPQDYRNKPDAALTLDIAPGDPAWWRRYGSDELDRLVARALADNPELKIAALRTEQARIRADQAKGGSLPTLTLPMRTGATNAGGVADAQQSSQVALQGNWRLDVWGEQRGLIESAQLQIWRAIHERENIQRLVIARLVSAYIAYLGANDAIDIARQHEALARSILATIERRLSLGDATADEREQQRSALYLQQAAMPGLLRQRETLAIGIAGLLGTTPERLTLSDRGLDELLVPDIRAGLPAALLLRRPDIRMMEARLRAANADIAVARARMLPPVDLGAQAGLSGLTLAQMFQPQSFLINTLASLVVTIFDGGRRAGNQALAQSAYEEMTTVYGQTVLEAVREVEVALASVRAAGQQSAAQRQITRSALERFRIVSDAYGAGAVELTSLMDARRNYQRSLDELQRAKAERLAAFAVLAVALGEGAPMGEDASTQSRPERVSPLVVQCGLKIC